jgi:phage FluMu protein Com
MDCGRCGSWLESPHADGLFGTDEEVTCPECQTVNQVGVEDDGGDGEENIAYVSHWTCRHGSDDATACAACDAEDGAASQDREGTP